MTWIFKYRLFINGEEVYRETYSVDVFAIYGNSKPEDPDAEEIAKEVEEEKNDSAIWSPPTY